MKRKKASKKVVNLFKKLMCSINSYILGEILYTTLMYDKMRLRHKAQTLNALDQAEFDYLAKAIARVVATCQLHRL